MNFQHKIRIIKHQGEKQMKKAEKNECPQLRYHITHEEVLTLKDLEDLINLIRISNNDTLQEMGISRTKGNDLQKIDKIEPGSIEIIMAVISVLSDLITIGVFAKNTIKRICDKMKSKRERPKRNPREDRKVYEKYESLVEIEERPTSENTYVIHIHIYNAYHSK